MCSALRSSLLCPHLSAAGYHPWFSHFIATDPTITKEEHYRCLFLNQSGSPTPEQCNALDALLGSLPAPRPLVQILDELRQNFITFPTAMLGEVGLDRSFHVPYNYDTSPRKLTPFTVPLGHQLAILEAQIDIAIELGRNVSVHSVKSQQATVDLLSRLHKKHGDSFYRISIDMHSCGFSPETWKSIEVIQIIISMPIAYEYARLNTLTSFSPSPRSLMRSTQISKHSLILVQTIGYWSSRITMI